MARSGIRFAFVLFLIMILITELTGLSAHLDKQFGCSDFSSIFSSSSSSHTEPYLLNGETRKSVQQSVSFISNNYETHCTELTLERTKAFFLHQPPADLRRKIRNAIPSTFNGSKYKDPSFILNIG